MSSVTSNNSSALQTISGKLSALRAKLTGWLAIHGLGRWLLIVLLIIVVDIVIDRYFQMDLPQRWIMLVVMLATACWFLFTKAVRPLLYRTSDDALVGKIESRLQGSGEHILSALQLARESDLSKTGTSPELANATITQGIEKVNSIDFTEALDHEQHRKDLILLATAGLGLAVLAVGILATSFLSTWFSRNVMLSSAQWPQPTYLEIDGAVDGAMVLPLGANHKQIVTITEDSSVTDVTVNLEVEGVSGNRTIYPMSPTGKLDGRERVFEINVTNEFRFRATTNDVKTDWVDVTYVEPPAVTDLQLQLIAPQYTGLEPTLLTGGGPFPVLEGSRLSIAAQSNKPLAAASLMAAGDLIELTIDNTNNQQLEFSVPALDQQDESQRLVGGEYQLKLVDATGMENLRPSKFSISIKEDQPPKVRADLLGISGLVSARAMLPASYQVADDYGLNQTFFALRWREPEDAEDAGDKTQTVYFEGLPAQRPVTMAKDVGVLDLLPLDLPQGTSLRVTVNAEDTLPESPNRSASKEFLLRVVSDEELRSDLLRREIEQRKSFEQIYQAQGELMSEVQVVAAQEIPEGMAPEKFHAELDGRLIALIRDQKGIGTKVDRIANRFEEFLVEIKNNRIDEAENELAPEQRIETRFDQRIIQPMRAMDQNLISLATRNMDNCRPAVKDRVSLVGAVEQTIEVQQEILLEMKKILAAMNTSENFQEIINGMLNVKASTKVIGRRIKKLKSNQTIESVEDAEDIFDD